jgi:hypothetical protein
MLIQQKLQKYVNQAVLFLKHHYKKFVIYHQPQYKYIQNKLNINLKNVNMK